MYSHAHLGTHTQIKSLFVIVRLVTALCSATVESISDNGDYLVRMMYNLENLFFCELGIPVETTQ